MKLDKAQLEALTKDYQTPEEMSELYAQMLQHMINRSLDAELTAHLNEAPEAAERRGNKRNGRTSKRVQSLSGQLGTSKNGYFLSFWCGSLVFAF